MTLADKLKTARPPKKSPAGPLWEGPSGAGRNGGITQGLLGRYLSCKERFRVLSMEGLKPADAFNPRMEYGNMWHVCEEAISAREGPCPMPSTYEEPLEKYVAGLMDRYPFQREQITHWHSLCLQQFPRYVDYWAKHPDVLARQPLLSEQVFDVPYRLPSGRAVRLRGKWDSVDLVWQPAKGDKSGGVWLQENKTKSQIDPVKIGRQLTFDLQTMTYLVALLEYSPDDGMETPCQAVTGKRYGPIIGVRYNVVRRSAHKSVESMVKKLEEDCRNGRAGEWFARWNVTVTPADVARFCRQCLDPVLENLCDDYEWWNFCYNERRSGVEVWDYQERRAVAPNHCQRHYRTPYYYDPLSEGGSGDVDAYLDTGSTAGLTRTEDLFPELK